MPNCLHSDHGIQVIGAGFAPSLARIAFALEPIQVGILPGPNLEPYPIREKFGLLPTLDLHSKPCGSRRLQEGGRTSI